MTAKGSTSSGLASADHPPRHDRMLDLLLFTTVMLFSGLFVLDVFDAAWSLLLIAAVPAVGSLVSLARYDRRMPPDVRPRRNGFSSRHPMAFIALLGALIAFLTLVPDVVHHRLGVVRIAVALAAGLAFTIYMRLDLQRKRARAAGR